jgi:RNA polymerase sigma factor (sigma-70 family)
MKRGGDMMETWCEQSDEALLRAYEKSGSEEAFCELVTRHLSMVLGIAMRRMGDRGYAEDVAQSVFTALAAKASRLKARPSLGAWLYRATLLKCTEIMRSEHARKLKTDSFSHHAVIESEGQSVWREALPVLDEAMAALPAADRNLLLLRFFEKRSFAEISALCGKSENAVQKQCERTLQRLSRLLRQKGVAISVAALASGLSTLMTQAVPTGLAITISQSALAGASLLSAKTFIIQTLEIMAQTKAKGLHHANRVGPKPRAPVDGFRIPADCGSQRGGLAGIWIRHPPDARARFQRAGDSVLGIGPAV